MNGPGSSPAAAAAQPGAPSLERGDGSFTVRQTAREMAWQTRSMTARHSLPTEELVAQYERGVSLRGLARHYGVAVGTVRARLREAGAPPRRRGAPSKDVDVHELVRLCQASGSIRRTATEMGVGRSTLGRRLQQVRH
jgi:transposase-like protein